MNYNQLIRPIILISLFFASCTDIIDVNVPNAQEQLVVDASIQWVKGTNGSEQSIYLSKSTPYFQNNQFVGVDDATVSIINLSTKQTFLFQPRGNGKYTTTEFIPIINNEYQLAILYKGEQYEAREKLYSVTPISKYEQDTLVIGEENLTLKIFTKDKLGVDNFYLLKTKFKDNVPVLRAYDDEQRDGNEIEFFVFSDQYEKGDQIQVEYSGISSKVFKYLNLLSEQAEGNDSFSPLPVPLKGNIKNTSNSKNKAFGLFRLGETELLNYTFE